MELGSLCNILQDETISLSWQDPLLSMLTDICRGMCYLHAHAIPIIHRDLKGDNCLVSRNNVVKVRHLPRPPFHPPFTPRFTPRFIPRFTSVVPPLYPRFIPVLLPTHIGVYHLLLPPFFLFQVGDFGESREMEQGTSTMTSIGTNYFCAPEILRDEAYVDINHIGFIDLSSFSSVLRDEAYIDSHGSKERHHRIYSSLNTHPCMIY